MLTRFLDWIEELGNRQLKSYRAQERGVLYSMDEWIDENLVRVPFENGLRKAVEELTSRTFASVDSETKSNLCKAFRLALSRGTAGLDFLTESIKNKAGLVVLHVLPDFNNNTIIVRWSEKPLADYAPTDTVIGFIAPRG